jgi:hypothetical protein
LSGITECQFNLQNDLENGGAHLQYAVACLRDATVLSEYDDEWYCPRHKTMIDMEYQDAAGGATGVKKL